MVRGIPSLRVGTALPTSAHSETKSKLSARIPIGPGARSRRARGKRDRRDEELAGRCDGHRPCHSARLETRNDRPRKRGADDAEIHEVCGISFLADDTDRTIDPDEQQ
jgi:hypothetical protein